MPPEQDSFLGSLPFALTALFAGAVYPICTPLLWVHPPHDRRSKTPPRHMRLPEDYFNYNDKSHANLQPVFLFILALHFFTDGVWATGS